MRIASTREIIEKLEAYEKEHGIGGCCINRKNLFIR